MILSSRVTPEPLESVRGFVGRLARANRLAPETLLLHMFGHQRLLSRPDLSVLAEVCQCSETQIGGLTIARQFLSGRWGWYLAGTTITQSYMASPRRPLVCPFCLADKPVHCGLWNLVLFVACPHHGCQLVGQCPACRRMVSPVDRLQPVCECGHDLRSDCKDAPAPSLLMARRVWSCLEGHSESGSDLLDSLGLDLLFKVLWWCGHVLPEAAAGHDIKALKLLDPVQAEMVIEQACAVLARGHEMEDLLSMAAQRIPRGTSASFLDQKLTSVHRFMQRELDNPALRPLQVAYENAVAALWATWGRDVPLRCLGLQASFPFDLSREQSKCLH